MYVCTYVFITILLTNLSLHTQLIMVLEILFMSIFKLKKMFTEISSFLYLIFCVQCESRIFYKAKCVIIDCYCFWMLFRGEIY